MRLAGRVGVSSGRVGLAERVGVGGLGVGSADSFYFALRQLRRPQFNCLEFNYGE